MPQKLGRNLARERGAEHPLPASKLPRLFSRARLSSVLTLCHLLPALTEHRTRCCRCFVNCSNNDFCGVPAGVGAHHLPAHAGRARGLDCFSSAPLFPSPEHRAAYPGTPPLPGSCSSRALLGSPPLFIGAEGWINGAVWPLPSIGFLAADSARVLMNHLPP